MHKLDIRLKTIADMVDKTEVIADIGTDHGYLPVYLLKNNIVKRAILTDLNEGPLQNARKTAKKYKVDSSCEFLKGDGLSPLAGYSADVISFCGMGGELISTMLENNITIAQSASRLIFQPMNNKEILQKKLLNEGFCLDEVRVVRDKKHFYFIFSSHFENTPLFYNECDLEFPISLIRKKDPLMKEYLTYRLNVEKRVYENALNGNSLDECKRREQKIKEIEERLGSYEG